MHVAFGRVRCKSRIVADYTDDADYRMGDGGQRSERVGNRSSLLQSFVPISEILRYKK